MFGSVDVVAQSVPVYGAFNPWWVLIWLALVAGSLMMIAGVVALFQLVVALTHRRSHRHNRLRISLPTDGMSA